MSLPPPSTPQNWAPPPTPGAATSNVRQLLFGDQPPRLPSSDEPAAISSLPAPLRTAVRKQIVHSIGDAVDMELADVVVRGWVRHKALRAAAERTRERGRELVDLADHTMVSTHRPTIDLSVDGAPLVTLHLMLQLSIRVVGVIAVVERASLVGLQSGALEVTASLKLGNDQLVARTQRLDAVHAVALTRPRPLLETTAS